MVASAAPQPYHGELANVLGHQIPFVGAVILFILGSGIGDSATNVDILIAGRAIQGVGACGLYVLLDIIVCDSVPLRERGQYLGIINSGATLGTAK